MNILTKIVRFLGWTWIAVAGLVIVVGYAMALFTVGVGAVLDSLNPQNVRNYIGVVLTLAPGLVLIQLADAIQQRLRGKIVAALVALPVTIGIVIIIIGIAIRSDIKDEKKWVDAIHVKDRPWRAHLCSDYLITSACSISGEIGVDDPRKLPAVIRVGDVITASVKEGKEFTFTVRNISVFTLSKDIDTVYGSTRLKAKKGDTICNLYDEPSRSTIDSTTGGAYLSKIVVDNCREVAATDKAEARTTLDLKNAFRQYETVVGVFPKEFLRFSTIEQEAYVRGVLDGEYYLSEENKDPGRDVFVSCLNAHIPTILSEAKSFVEREGEQKDLMPWTLSRLVGKTCPKETRMPPKNSPEYTEAATYVKLISKKPSDKIYSEKQQDAIDKAFIRGVLDGKVFRLYGHSYPKLVDYLECLSKPGSLDTIFRSMRISQDLGQNLDKSQAYNVVQGEAIVCEELNKK